MLGSRGGQGKVFGKKRIRNRRTETGTYSVEYSACPGGDKMLAEERGCRIASAGNEFDNV